MEYLELWFIPFAAVLEWWTMFWSHNEFFNNVFLSLIFVSLLFRFILSPLFKGGAGSDRADQHPRRK